jgi:hypothetical protein
MEYPVRDHLISWIFREIIAKDRFAKFGLHPTIKFVSLLRYIEVILYTSNIFLCG